MKLSRTELSKKYELNNSQWTRKHDELMDWLKDFMDIKEVKTSTSRYYYIIEGDMPETIPPLPRKSSTKQKEQDYEEYVINNLPKEPTPLSKAKMARDAIGDFGCEKYNHTSFQAVSRRYVGPAMEKQGEHGVKMVWVNLKDYSLLTEEQEQYLHNCFNKVHLSELEMANAFKKYAQEEDITEEVNNFNRVIDMFKKEFNFRPISVYEWQAKGGR